METYGSVSYWLTLNNIWAPEIHTCQFRLEKPAQTGANLFFLTSRQSDFHFLTASGKRVDSSWWTTSTTTGTPPPSGTSTECPCPSPTTWWVTLCSILIVQSSLHPSPSHWNTRIYRFYFAANRGSSGRKASWIKVPLWGSTPLTWVWCPDTLVVKIVEIGKNPLSLFEKSKQCH